MRKYFQDALAGFRGASLVQNIVWGAVWFGVSQLLAGGVLGSLLHLPIYSVVLAGIGLFVAGVAVVVRGRATRKTHQIVTADPVQVEYHPYWWDRSDGQLIIGLEWDPPDFGSAPSFVWVTPPDSSRRESIAPSSQTGSRYTLEAVYPSGFGIEGTAPPG